MPQIDPAAADYDPGLLAYFANMGRVFTAEPREDRWAGPLEADIARRLGDDLKAFGVDPSTVNVECKSSMCLLRWKATAESEKNVQTFVREFWGGTGSSNSGKDAMVVSYRGGLYGDTRQPSQVLARLAEHRTQILTSARVEQQHFLKDLLPIEAWPKD